MAKDPTVDKRTMQTRVEGGFPPSACNEPDSLPENVPAKGEPKEEPKGE